MTANIAKKMLLVFTILRLTNQSVENQKMNSQEIPLNCNQFTVWILIIISPLNFRLAVSLV